MNRSLALVFAAATLLYLPTIRYGFVQDDRAIVAANPAVHSLSAAVRGFDAPYWPPPGEGGLYRPFTILSFAVDWAVSGGRPGWFHFVNVVCHGLVAVLATLVVARWLPGSGGGATLAGLMFAVHPVHVEAVAGIVSRAELLAALGILGAVLAARRRRWGWVLALSAVAMLSKEHGVVVGVVILIDDWLNPDPAGRYPKGLYAALGALTIAYLGVWYAVGRAGAADVAAPFIGAGALARLRLALPANFRAAMLLVWPVDLSADYSPQVIAVPDGFTLAAGAGLGVVLGVVGLGVASRRRAPALAFAALAGAMVRLPTSNLIFASGIVLAERDLYLTVLLPAVLAAVGFIWIRGRWRRSSAIVLAATLVVALAGRSLLRLPSWTDNRTFLLTLLSDHPESYRGNQSAAAVFAGMGDTAAALRAYARADSLFSGDPHLKAAYAFYLLGLRHGAQAAELVDAARRVAPLEPIALRCAFLLARQHGDSIGGRAIRDTAVQRYPTEAVWYAGGHRAP